MQFQVSSRRENRWRDTSGIKFRVLRKVFSKQFCYAEDNTSGLLNRGGIADLPLLRTLLAIRLVLGAKLLGSNGLFCLISICKIDSFKNLSGIITSLHELNFRLRSILLVQKKKVISMNYNSSTNSLKPWRWLKLQLILLIRDIYINSSLKALKKFISCSRSREFKDILPQNISQIITKTIPFSTRIVKSNAMKQGNQLWIWWKVNRNWDNMIRISQWMESEYRTNTSIRRKR